MDISKIRELIADNLGKPETENIWHDEILIDTNPANYGTESVGVTVSPKDIWVDIPHRTFTFTNTDLSFSARLAGSSDRNGFDQYFQFTVSGEGQFEFSDGSTNIAIETLSINEKLDLFADDNIESVANPSKPVRVRTQDSLSGIAKIRPGGTATQKASGTDTDQDKK
jgi:hypothetical protein